MHSPLPFTRRDHTHTRHAQPQFPRSRSQNGSTSSLTSAADGTMEGATPVESAMWRDRFRRRCAEKQRRDTERKDQMARRRGIHVRGQDEMQDEDEEEATKRAELEDEEVGLSLTLSVSD